MITIISSILLFELCFQAKIAELFTGPRFTSSNVQARLRKVENQFRSSLRLFEGRYAERLIRSFVLNFSFDVQLLNDIEELLTCFDWSQLHGNPANFNRFEVLLATNKGRDLPPLKLERILQVRSR